MATNVGVEPCLTQRRPAATAAWRFAPWLALAALFVAAVIMRHLLPANPDVSWLLTVAERIWDGQRLYVEIIETNPPIAPLTYVPGVVIARELGLPAEIVTDGLVFAAAFASLAIVARLLKNSPVLDGVAGWPLALLGLAVLIILPAKTFGQREHIAVIALLPALAVAAIRMKNQAPPLWGILAAGVGAGLTLAFKPHFVIGILCALAALAVHARSRRVFLAPENFIAAAVVAIYALCVIAFYPEYLFAIVPLMRDVYVLVGASPLEMIKTPAVSIWAAALFAALLLKRNGRIDGTPLVLVATSFGFMAAFFLQRKGWPYHSYPMIAFSILALGYGLSLRPPPGRTLRIVATAVLAITFFESIVWFNWAFDKAFDARPLWTSIARLGPHPKILAITGEPGIGHPLVRALQGTWVSRQQALWVDGYLRTLRNNPARDPRQLAMLEHYGAREREMLIEDIRNNEPTVVLVDNFSDQWSDWLGDHPDVADLLRDYRLVATVNDIEIRARAR
jgi:hypothetical protein